MKHPRYPVTDHAIVRYLERVEGLDINAVRAEISRIVARGIEHHAGGVVFDGRVYKLRDGVVTTVVYRNRLEPGYVKPPGRCDDR